MAKQLVGMQKVPGLIPNISGERVLRWVVMVKTARNLGELLPMRRDNAGLVL